MPYVNMRCAECYQLELFFALFCLPLIVMGNPLIGNGYACDACVATDSSHDLENYVIRN